MYDLLHHADALARQLEAAGVPEAKWSHESEGCDLDDSSGEVRYEWLDKNDDWIAVIRLAPDGGYEATTYLPGALEVASEVRLRVGDPLPDALVAAIKASESNG